MRLVFIVSVGIGLLSAVAVGYQDGIRICEPGKGFRVGCNTCRCNRDGTNLACTQMQCPPEYYWLPEIKFCEPGTFFKIDCNDCKCNEEGNNAICTLRGCPRHRTNLQRIFGRP